MIFIGSVSGKASSGDTAAKGREQRGCAVARSCGSAAARADSEGCLWPRAGGCWGPWGLSAGWMHPIAAREDLGPTLHGVGLFVL